MSPGLQRVQGKHSTLSSAQSHPPFLMGPFWGNVNSGLDPRNKDSPELDQLIPPSATITGYKNKQKVSNTHVQARARARARTHTHTKTFSFITDSASSIL